MVQSFDTEFTKKQRPLIASLSATPSIGGPLLTTSSAPSISSGGGLLSTSAAPAFNFKGLSSTAPGTALGTSTLTGAGLLGGSTGFNTNTTSSQFSTGFSFGATPAPFASVQPVSTASTSKNIGLGGVDANASTASTKDGGNGSDKSTGKSLKSTEVPKEILSAVESFKQYVKKQKIITEEISRISSKPMVKVGEETAALKQLVSVISNGIHRNATFVSRLKQESARELKNVEIAKQTKDLPAGMQYENTVPIEYFQRKVIESERRMLSYKQQIEELEHHLMSLNHSAPVNPNELTMMVKRIHETFVALAAQLHSINEGVNAQKEQFLRHRKTTLGDSRDIFAERLKGANSNESSSKAVVGPSAFSDIPNVAADAMVSALNSNQQTPGNMQSGSLFSQNKGLGTTASGLTFGSATQSTNAIRPTFGATSNPSFGIGQSTSGFGSNFSFGNTSAVRPLGK